MKTNEVIKELEIGRKTLLLYEKRGFIHPKRDLSNYRIYSDNDIKQLKKIIILRKMDFSLDEIEKILSNPVLDLSYKKNEYDQKISELEMKKQFIEKNTLPLELDKNIDQFFFRMRSVFNEEKEVIPFSISKDGFFFLWFFCLILSIYTGNIYFIAMTVLLGLSLSIIALRKKKILFPWLTYFSSMLLIVCGIIGLYVQWKIEDLSIKSFTVCYSYIIMAYGLFLIGPMKSRILNHHKLVSNIFMILGIIIIIVPLFIDFFFNIFSLELWKNYGYLMNILGDCCWLIGILLKKYEM